MNNTKAILDVLAHAINLAQNELEQAANEPEIKIKPAQSKAETERIPCKIRTFHSDKYGDLDATVIDGKPYFRGDSVAAAIGYKSPGQAVAYNCNNRKMIRLTAPTGRTNYVQFIPPEDVRKLISKRKMDIVEGFELWFETEVIPNVSDSKMKQVEPDPGAAFHTVTHREYGTIQLAVFDSGVYYRAIDIGSMLGYASAKCVSHNIENKIIMTAPNPKAPLNYLRSAFVPLSEVELMFQRRKLDKIPVCRKMFDWLASLEIEYAPATTTVHTA